MFKLDLPQDPSEAAAIEARRARESARLTRIMNPRLRTMGKDMEALQTQVSFVIILPLPPLSSAPLLSGPYSLALKSGRARCTVPLSSV